MKHSLLCMFLYSFGGISWACGPNFPTRILTGGDEIVLQTPIACFHYELQRLLPKVEAQTIKLPQKVHWQRSSVQAAQTQQTHDADRLDLVNALASDNVMLTDQHNILDAHEQVRELIGAYQHQLECYKVAQEELALYRNIKTPLPEYYLQRWKSEGVDPRVPMPPFSAPEIPQNFPLEFKLYLEGACFYHAQSMDMATAKWQTLLKLPAEKRKYRSVWAAFMLGKVQLYLLNQNLPLGIVPSIAEEAPTNGSDNLTLTNAVEKFDANSARRSITHEAIRCFQWTRTLAQEGFIDSLNLAQSSLGWEAMVHLKAHGVKMAMELYLQQYELAIGGSDTSLELTCKRAISTQQLDPLAQSERLRPIMTAYVLSRYSSHDAQAWLKAIEATKLENIKDADRIAWASYKIGDFEAAKRWISLALPEETMTLWLKAKLLLRENNVDAAIAHLVTIEQRFPAQNRALSAGIELRNSAGWLLAHGSTAQCIRGELGGLYQGRGEYILALEMFLKGGFWEDAATIAERVLELDELETWMGQQWPLASAKVDTTLGEVDGIVKKPLESETSLNSTNLAWARERLTHLLARRLAREGQWDKALKAYPTEVYKTAANYLHTLKKGRDKQQARNNQAAALWEASLLIRYQGLSLMGYELGPDWSVYGGMYDLGKYGDIPRTSLGQWLKLSENEKHRIQSHQPQLDLRRHYIYMALDLAWEAIALMPDNHLLTAQMLMAAGSWVKAKNPEAADRFYKDLVLRCPKLPVAQEADRLRWFPKVEVDDRALSKQILDMEP